MTAQGTLGFFLPRPLVAEDFREAVGRWLAEVPALNASQSQVRNLFHHAADGSPLQGLSPYRFTSNAHFGHIHSIGATATQQLKGIAAQLSQLPPPNPWLGQPQWSEDVVGLDLLPSPKAYWVADLVICRDATQHKLWSQSNDAGRRQHVADIIYRGIKRQASLLGFNAECSPPEIRVITRERAVPKLPKKEANALVRLASVGFALPAQLRGHWAAGALINRGYGSIQVL